MNSFVGSNKFKHTLTLRLLVAMSFCYQTGSVATFAGHSSPANDSKILARAKSAAKLDDMDIRPYWSPTDPDPKTDGGRFFHNAYQLQKKQLFEKAISEYKEATLADPKLMVAFYNMGLCYEHQSKWDEAEAAFKQVLTLQKMMPSAYKHLATLCFKQGRSAEARDYINMLHGL